MCNYHISWVGDCKKPEHENGMCEEHAKLKCVSCGNPATHSCAETIWGLVCGCPLCKDCEHELNSEGVNGGGHCKKGDQKYDEWYVTTAIQNIIKDKEDGEQIEAIALECVEFYKKNGRNPGLKLKLQTLFPN